MIIEIIKFCDNLNSIMQSIFFVWVCNNIASKKNKISKIKSILLAVLITVDIYIFTYSPISPALANFGMMSVILCLIILFYNKALIDAFVSFGISYMYIATVSYVTLTLDIFAIRILKLNNYDQKIVLVVVYLIAFASYYIFYKFRKTFFNFGYYIKTLKHSIIIVQVIDYTLLFIATLQGEWVSGGIQTLFKSVMIAVFATIYVLESIYFARINDKSKEVEKLNEVLNTKITELRKLKHDYGSEISTIYGIYQLGNYEKLGNILKGIIEKNQSISATIEFKQNDNPIIASLLNQAALKGINVITYDQADYSNLNIGDNEFLRLVSNIINNAIDATKDIQNPIIRFNSYNNYDGVIIVIENNGPQIPNDIIDRIFTVGFSTKKNDNNDRGFGLSIVKEITEKCGGSISVESNDERTTFKIYIPSNLRLLYS